MNDIHHNESDSRGIFYIKEDNITIGELTYSIDEDIMTIDHTEVNPNQEGKGLGSQLVEESYAFAKANNRKIRPLCPFAEVVFDRHEDWSDVRV